MLYLAPAIFTLQVFDRVIPSNSVETLMMLLLARLNDRFTRATRNVEGSLRHAEVLQVMGMTGRLLGRWHQQQDVVLELQTRVTRTSWPSPPRPSSCASTHTHPAGPGQGVEVVRRWPAAR